MFLETNSSSVSILLRHTYLFTTDYLSKNGVSADADKRKPTPVYYLCNLLKSTRDAAFVHGISEEEVRLTLRQELLHFRQATNKTIVVS